MSNQPTNSPEAPKSNQYQIAKDKITAIEAELKQLGRWQNDQLPPEKLENMGAFGMNTMSIEQWIQFILIPRVEKIITEKGDFPLSQFAVYATRNLDGDPEGAKLIQLIQEFDAIINNNNN